MTEATRRGIAGLLADAATGEGLVVTSRGVPIAAVMSVDRLADLDAARDDLIDLALVLGRAATDIGNRTGLDQVLAAFGQSRESLAGLVEDQF
ncbi:MAG: type II toxin-antitoxin system prevent-host-death family antitoxin [Candidatus Dormiibacterota bacterium]